MAITIIIIYFVETPRIIYSPELSIRKPGSSSVEIKSKTWLQSQRNNRHRARTDRCKHCGRLRFSVPTFFKSQRSKIDQLRVLGKLLEQFHPMRCTHLLTCRACARKKWVHEFQLCVYYLLCGIICGIMICQLKSPWQRIDQSVFAIYDSRSTIILSSVMTTHPELNFHNFELR